MHVNIMSPFQKPGSDIIQVFRNPENSERQQNTAACRHLTQDADRCRLPAQASAKQCISKTNMAAATRTSNFWSNSNTKLCLSVIKDLNAVGSSDHQSADLLKSVGSRLQDISPQHLLS